MGTRNLGKSLPLKHRDHPHAYGDKCLKCRREVIQLGSSPRVWGQVLIHIALSQADRIIPTRMGTSLTADGRISADRDHPHAYGDKLHHSLHSSSVPGSSPRVWGQGYQSLHRHMLYGIIPTRMGTSHLVSSVGVYNWDHPHAYGDKGIFRRHRRYCLGSSPRVWGQEVQAGTNSLHLRIIPTRMGTRAPAGQIYGSMRDHPHAYGDKLKKQTTANQCTGSSPRVWGQGLLR